MAGCVQKTGKVQVQLAKDVDGIGICDVVNRYLTGVVFTFYFLIDGMPAIAMCISCGMRIVLSVSRLYVLIGCLLRVLVALMLRGNSEAESAKN